MNKGQLIDRVAKDCDISKTNAGQLLSSILNTISKSVAAGDKVTLMGFGTFSVRTRAAREGRNPMSGKAIQIPEKKIVKFKAGRAG